MSFDQIQVSKRDGSVQLISPAKIYNRLYVLNKDANLTCEVQTIVKKVFPQLFNGITTAQIDTLTAEQCASMSTVHPDYNTLAGRIVVSNHQKKTIESFADTMMYLYDNLDVHGNWYPLLADDFIAVIREHGPLLDEMIVHERDYLIDFFGFKTLERSYLMKREKLVVERPQHMWLRVALGIHGFDLHRVKETYDLMSLKYFTHATPTLFNAGTRRPQLSSCFLVALQEDSIDGIYETLRDCALISKFAGGIGLHIHNVRATGSHIRGTNGTSNGIVPMLRVFNQSSKYVDQGGGKRNGSIAIYLEPWHADIEVFLQLRKNHGDEELKARDLFYGLWIPDLFMERVESDGTWTLFCPHECPGLAQVWGAAFEALYTHYESKNLGKKTMQARQLWLQILDAQMETGTPYICFKDAANRKSNQQNLGTIQSSNLCSEIIEYSDSKETAVCNLASIGLPSFVEDQTFDFEKLHAVTKVITRNLNQVIDKNYYPTPKTRLSNLRHRPIGIGIQGLADVFLMMRIPFTSLKAKELNKWIFETMYHAALECSMEMAKERFDAPSNSVVFLEEEVTKLHGTQTGAYSSFHGSPAFYGELQFDLWDVTPTVGRYDWNALKSSILLYGLRNSLLLAPMPTASTSQILGFNECFEPITSNIYRRSTIAGEFMMVNKYLAKELLEMGLWTDEVVQNIIANRGSVQQIDQIPEAVRERFLTVWELPNRELIDMAVDRGAFICQSQSLNLWDENPTYNRMTSMHLYSWRKGLKTGVYYFRRRPRHQAQQFTIVPEQQEQQQCTEECEVCSA